MKNLGKKSSKITGVSDKNLAGLDRFMVNK
jgi:hypothetical protein